MITSAYFALLACISYACALPFFAKRQSAENVLSLATLSGGNVNQLYRDTTTAAQILLPGSPSILQRFLVALPADNNGALTYFQSYDNTTAIQVALDNTTLASTTLFGDSVGVSGVLDISGEARLGVTIVGAIRAVRDYVEGSGTMHEIFNYTIAESNATYLHLHRDYINGTGTVDFVMSAAENFNFEYIPPADPNNISAITNQSYFAPTVNLRLANGSTSGRVGFSVSTNAPQFTGFATDELFLSPGQGDNSSSADLTGLADGSIQAARELSFLTQTSTWFAGGWRFLTYFGRDTLITVDLMLPVLQAGAIEAVFGATLSRANSTGLLCHEETVGDYASFININNNQSDLGATNFYDYKMIDTDFLLLPALARYFLNTTQGAGRADAFLARNSTLLPGSFRDLLTSNIEHVLNVSAPFAASQTVENLIHLREGEPVGNWRDSNEGLGYGTIPLDVNTALVPAALRAIEEMSNNGLIDSGYAANASQAAAIWENSAFPFFEVTVSESDAASRLQNFVQQTNLSTTLLEAGNTTNSSSTGNSTFYALSLFDDGTPVEVLNSDIGFALFYGNNISETVLERTVDLLRPYPLGLLSPIGMLVANPAYDSNTTNIQVLGRQAYHGTVSWSWQTSLMINGLIKQLGRCDQNATAPAWCGGSLRQSLETRLSDTWASVNGAPQEIFGEVWSFAYDTTNNTFSVVDLASIAPTGTESDAFQTWSYSFLALDNPGTA